MRKSVFCGALLAALTASLPALADDILLSRHIDVWPLGAASAELGAGQTFTARVKVPVGAAVPALHIIDPEGEELAGADDVVQIDARTVEISWTHNWIDTRVVELLVYAHEQSETVENAVLELVTPTGYTSEDLDIRSYVREAGCGGHEIRMTPLPGDDLTRPMWMIGKDAQGELVFSQPDGIGGQPLLAFQHGLCQVLVGTRAGTTGYQDKAWIIVNDADADADWDGLGAALEHELGLCDSRADSWCSEALVPDLWDVDRDGLTDGEEVMGVLNGHPYWSPNQAVAATAQMLPRWGANPRHRDIFIELDREASATVPATLAANLQQTADIFKTPGTAAFLHNPDQLDGIALHFDVGQNPSTVALAQDPSLATLFGDWGGSTTVPDDTNHDDVNLPSRTVDRRGRFFFGAWHKSNDSWGSRETARILIGDGNASPVVIAHELGHVLGLHHWGHDDWGLSDCKPNYRSLMSYAPNITTFSFGDAGWTINPAKTYEWIPDVADAPWLTSDPWLFDSISGKVDWNRSGAVDFGVAVRSQPSWLIRTNGAGCNMAMADQEPLNQASSLVAPALVEMNDRLYSISVQGGQIKVKVAPFVANGPDASCTGDDGRYGPACLTFSPAATSPAPVGTTVGKLDAVAFKGQIVIAFTSNGTLRVAKVTDTSSNLTLKPSLSWTVETIAAAGTALAAPEIAILPTFSGWNETSVDPLNSMPAPPPSGGPVDSFLSLTWLDAQNTLQTSTRLISGWSAPMPLRGPNQAALKGSETPSMIQIPGKLFAARCGIFLDPVAKGGRPMVMRCQDPNGTWSDKQAFFTLPSAQSPTVPISRAGKVTVAYHALRRSDGALMAADMPGELQIVQAFEDGSYKYPKVWYSQTLTPGTISTARFDRSGPFGNVWTELPDGNLLALHGSARMTGLKGLFVRALPDNAYDLVFLPEADGIVDELLQDGNDWEVMDSCVPLKGEDCHTL